MSRTGKRLLALAVAWCAAVAVGVAVTRWQADDGPGGAPGWDVLALPVPPQGTVTAAAPAGDDLFLLGTDTGEVWPTSRERVADAPLFTLPTGVHDLRVSPDGGHVAAVDGIGALYVAPVSGGATEELTIGQYDARGTLGPDGETFVFGAFAPALLDVASGRRTTLPEKPVPDEGATAYEDWALTDDGLVRAARLEGVATWVLDRPDEVGELAACDCAAVETSLSADGATATFGTADGHVVVVDVESGTVRADKTIATGGFTNVWSTATVGTGTYAAGAGPDGQVVVFDVTDRRTVWEHTFPDALVDTLTPVPESDALLAFLAPHPDSPTRPPTPSAYVLLPT